MDDDYDYGAEYNEDWDPYQDEELENGHDEDEEDVELDRLEEKLYDDENEENPSDLEYEEDGILGIEREQEDTVDDFIKKKKAIPNKIVPENKRKTRPYMTKFEYSYLVSQRAMMIENGSPLMIPDTKLIHAIDIAKEETEKKVNPIIIQRILPSGFVEEWKCSELNPTKMFS